MWTEATGYDCVYFSENTFNQVDDSLKGKTCVVLGSGTRAESLILVAEGNLKQKQADVAYAQSQRKVTEASRRPPTAHPAVFIGGRSQARLHYLSSNLQLPTCKTILWHAELNELQVKALLPSKVSKHSEAAIFLA